MQEKRLERMSSEKMMPLILSFSLPSIVSMSAMAMYNIVDTIFVGLLGTEAIAGLTLMIPLNMLLLAFSLLIGVGATSYISRALGAKQYEQAHHIFSSVTFAASLVGLILMGLALVFLRDILEFIGRNSPAIKQAYDFGFVLSFSIPVVMLTITLNQCARAEGNPNISMTSLLVGTAVNIILDPIFIFGLNWGIKGAALATDIANVISLVIVLSYFIGPKSHLQFRLRLIKPTGLILKELGKAGLPSFTSHIAASFVIALTNSMLAGYGAFALAIMGINNRLIMLFFMPMIGTGQGFMPIAGYNYGAKNFERVKEAFWKAVILVTGICTFGWILIQLFPELFIRVFSTDPIVIEQGRSSLHIINLMLPLVGFQIIGATLYQAMGEGLAGFILSITRQVLVFLPLVIVFRALFGLKGIFFAIPTADLLAGLIIFFWLRSTFKGQKLQPATVNVN
ncbi:MAG: MATE family efflux transporter [Candidatus Zhuqueibacterota bacterium]